MPKNILIFSDGTGQEGGRTLNTNIYKLFNMVEDRTPEQIAFYDRGVGTGLARLAGLATGSGFGRNVRDCYTFIFDNFEANDRLFLFGFSRGAATVRSLSYFIHLFGILPHSRPELIPKAWEIYQIRDHEKRKREAVKLITRHHTMWAKVHFLGCYDTVAALGAPFPSLSAILDRVPWFRHKFHSFRISPSVVHAYQALAIDDERETFHPLLWDPIQDEDPDQLRRQGKADEVLRVQTMRQVWFAGMHTDVGGGYNEQSLSDIPLVWLTHMAVNHGLLIYPNHGVPINEDADGVMHDSRGTRLTKLYTKRDRFWDPTRTDRPVIHESVFQRKRGRSNSDDPGYRPWIASLQAHEREPWVKYADQSWFSRT